MKKFLISLIVLFSVILAGLIVVFVLVVNGTITKETFGIGAAEPAALVVEHTEEQNAESPQPTEETPAKGIVVIDPGHGKSSSAMSEAEKTEEGWIYSSAKGAWGEWRHWKSGTAWQDCEGSGCCARGDCWYPIVNGDRDIEPEINLRNAEFAKAYLEELGYEVRMTREGNENPSMTKRLTYCYKDGDTTSEADADVFVCIHSNAGGGRGSAYMSLSGTYDRRDGDDLDYVSKSNALGSMINDSITKKTSMPAWAGGAYGGLPEAILFCKSPIPIAYLEIGFFDNQSDLNILETESEAIGKAIAEGIDEYFGAYGQN